MKSRLMISKNNCGARDLLAFQYEHNTLLQLLCIVCMEKRYKLCDCDSELCSTPYWNRLYHDGHTCIHIDGSWHEIEQKPLIRVKYKFHDDEEEVAVSITEKQYVNLLDVSIIERCDILGSAEHPINSQEKELFNQKILVAYQQNSGYRKYLLQ